MYDRIRLRSKALSMDSGLSSSGKPILRARSQRSFFVPLRMSWYQFFDMELAEVQQINEGYSFIKSILNPERYCTAVPPFIDNHERLGNHAIGSKEIIKEP